MWRHETEKRPEAKEDIVQFQKTWYPRDQLTEIYNRVKEPKKLWKKGAP